MISAQRPGLFHHSPRPEQEIFMKPTVKPANPNFSSGPCAKRPGYNLGALRSDILGRSHRSALGKSRLAESIDLTKKLLELPAGYRVGIVPASDTGAFEMAMWSMLGARGIDVFSWESFGEGWATDIKKQLKLTDVRYFTADYGKLPDLTQADFARDVVFTWNGTTSGVKVPDGNWISAKREGLTFCDATSAVFAMDIPWEKLDVITWSWQKVLGGEGAHGMLVLSPRAVERLTSYKPAWPLPKIFRMTKGNELLEEIFEGSTINTPSMVANEDHLDALAWAESVGGLKGLMKRSEDNLAVFEKFVSERKWIRFLAEDKKSRSNTSVCFSLELTPDQVKAMVKLLAGEKAAYDCGAYKDAPPGLRFWCGATVETSDIEKLLPWLDWAYEEAKKS
jgi:phosphoserine aminotransferase